MLLPWRVCVISLERINQMLVAFPSANWLVRARTLSWGDYLLHWLIPVGDGRPVEAVFRRGGAGGVETQANMFAASLFMSACAFQQVYEESDGDVLAVAGQFNVSQSAAAVRASVLGLRWARASLAASCSSPATWSDRPTTSSGRAISYRLRGRGIDSLPSIRLSTDDTES